MAALLQVDAANLLQLLESQDLDLVSEIEALIKDNLHSSRESWLLNGIVDSYMVSQSARCMEILASVQEPHDKHLMDRIAEYIKSNNASRLAAMMLFAYIVRKQPPWLYMVARHSLMSTLIKILKTDSDVPVLMCGVLIIASLMPVIPVAITHHLPDIFEAFSRLVVFNIKKPGNVPDVYLLHLQVGVYALFHRLYGMYPCNFLTYLRATYCKPDHKPVFEDLIKPMLERVRMHPLLVTASKDKELATDRWRHKEVHDIMVECARMSLDPIEGWSEESLGSVVSQDQFKAVTAPSELKTFSSNKPELVCPPAVMSDMAAEPLPPVLIAQDPLWSPSNVCGLSTPPPVTPGAPSSGTTSVDQSTVPTPSTEPLTQIPYLVSHMSHVDSPLPHDETEKRRLAMLNTHLAVQMASTNGETNQHVSVPPSPLKPDFSSEPPFHLHSLRAIRKINFDSGPPDASNGQVAGPQHLGSMIQERSDNNQLVVTTAEEAVEDNPAAAAAATASAEMAPTVQQVPSAESSDVGTEEVHDEIPASVLSHSRSSVPSLHQLPQFIDSLDVSQTAQDKLEEIDKEVSELTQDGNSTSGSEMDMPTHLPADMQMTAESVAAFMRQVNRIRFNSMNVTQSDKAVKDKQYSRSNSCPNLKDNTAKLDEALEDEEESEASGALESLTVVPPPAGCTARSQHVTRITTTIQTQTSIISTADTNASPNRPTSRLSPKPHTTDADNFYQSLMNILLPPSTVCEKCGKPPEKLPVQTPAAVTDQQSKTRAAGPFALVSPGGVPVYTTMSPPEMLDRHIMLGSDGHAQHQARIPLTSQSDVSWTHFGGVPPADEVSILSGQLHLLHTQLMFERHKSELHAKRNRRLLGRTVKTVALEEQNNAMQDQLRLQENEIQSLSESLHAQQQLVSDLRVANDKHVCDRQVLHKTHSEEVEKLQQSKDVLQNELRLQKEENNKLNKELLRARKLMFSLEQELEVVQSKVGHTDELQTEVTRLTKELLLMGELQQKYQQRLVAVTNSHNSKPEMQFVLDSYKAELASLRVCLDQKSTLLESTKARLNEAEDCTKQKELMLTEDKKLMDHLRVQHKAEIQSLEEKYRAQKKIQQGLHSQILDLYGQIPVSKEMAMLEEAVIVGVEQTDSVHTSSAGINEALASEGGGHEGDGHASSEADGCVNSEELDAPQLHAPQPLPSFTPHTSSAFKSYHDDK